MGQEEKRREVVREYERGGVTLRELGRRHGVGKSLVHRWVREAEAAGGVEELERRTLAGELTAKRSRELPRDVKRLQEELAQARLHNELLNAMIDIAEDRLGIAIRKKPGAKR